MKMFFLFRFQKMQHIFHHNSSGNNAYTGDLLSREVLRAISLHPIKISNYQYRLHNFMNLRQIIDLRQRSLLLKREVFKLKTEILNAELNSIANNTARICLEFQKLRIILLLLLLLFFLLNT